MIRVVFASLIALFMLAVVSVQDATAAATPGGVAQVPVWSAPVMDLTQALQPQAIRELTHQVQLLEQTQGSQLFVLLVPTTYSESIEQYARRVFDQWAVGRKGIDDGVLLLVALQDRQMRIEVGYGLEGAVTDVDAGRIIRELISPHFAQEDIAGGLQAGVQALAGLIAGEPLPAPVETSDDEDVPAWWIVPLTLLTLVVPPAMSAFLLWGFVMLVTENFFLSVFAAMVGIGLSYLGRYMGWALPYESTGSGGSGGGGGFGGGFGGGSSGGGGGGGGGRGGGGGASGGW